MPKITQSEIQSLPDLIDQSNFTFNLGQIPGWGDTSGLVLKCATVMLPGTGTEVYPVNVGSWVRNFRGRKMWSRMMQVSYFEDSLMRSHNALRNWLEFIVGTDSGTSGDYLPGYSVEAVLHTYDTTGAQIDVATFYNLFPQDLQDTQLSSENSAPVLTNVSFVFDYAEFNNVAVR